MSPQSLPRKLRQLRGLVVLSIALSLPCTASFGQTHQALLVVANPEIPPEDLPLVNVLDGLEYQFTVVQGSVVTAADADGKDIVVISETVQSGDITSKFSTVTVPVVTLEGFIQDDMFFTGLSQDVDFGFAAEAGTFIMATEPGHPILGGLPAGPVQVYDASGAMQWGIPVPSATVLATMPADDGLATLYVFEPGAELGDGSTAPARRVFYGGLHSSASAIVSETGTILMANIILWAAGRESEIIPIEGGLTAIFTATPSSGFAPLTVSFDASGSSSSGEIISYEWDFGDGTSGSDVNVTHDYAAAGDYLVTLTVTDDQGGVGSLSITIFVGEPVSFEPHFTIPHADTPPEIDGEMDAVWSELAVSLPIENLANDSAPTDAQDLSASVYVLYDVNYLYVFYDVTDDDLQNDSEASWEDDAVDLYLDGGLQKCFRCYDADDGQFEFSWNSDVITGNAASGARGENVLYVWQETDAGYTIEARVPWVNFGVDPTPGMVIGIEFMVNDDDGGGTRDTKLAWFATEDNTFQYAHLMGNAELGASAVSAEEATDVPQRLAIESVYPNPFNPRATAVLSVQESGPYEVRVFNLLGSLVTTASVLAPAPGRLEVALELGQFASGMYLFSVRHVSSGKSASARAMLLK